MFQLKTESGPKWVNPDHIVSAQDEAGYVVIRMVDGHVIYARGTTAAHIAQVVNGGDQ